MSGGVTPRSVVLNLARVAPPAALPISRLIAIGELFGFTANALRVAVARLVADGLLESDERGSYRLGPTAAPVQAFVEDWRRGEGRRRAWQGEWLAISLSAKVERARRRRSLQALSRLGLREGCAGLWLRPDNLALSLEDIVERLHAFGLEDRAQPFRARDFSEALDRKLRTLWPTRTLQKDYERALRELQRSKRQLEAMPLETALVQSFLRGGEAIRVLATDPLLPEAIMSGDTRRELGETMVGYDRIGRQLWRSYALRSRLTVLAGGRDAR
jgi:phenylacetic acid degradation operon negative regulatory protein